MIHNIDLQMAPRHLELFIRQKNLEQSETICIFALKKYAA